MTIKHKLSDMSSLSASNIQKIKFEIYREKLGYKRLSSVKDENITFDDYDSIFIRTDK